MAKVSEQMFKYVLAAVGKSFDSIPSGIQAFLEKHRLFLQELKEFSMKNYVTARPYIQAGSHQWHLALTAIKTGEERVLNAHKLFIHTYREYSEDVQDLSLEQALEAVRDRTW
jgi:hypothetical protein